MTNTCTIHGNLSRDPILKQVGSKNTELAEFTVAVTTKRGNTEDTAFVDCKAWAAVAERVGQFKKGDGLFVTGAIRTESWDDKDTGKKRYKTILQADLAVGMPTGGQRTANPPAEAPAARPARPSPAPAPAAEEGGTPW